MLPSMNDDILDHLKSRGVSTVPSLLDLSREELRRVLQPFSASELYQVLLSWFSHLKYFEHNLFS
jgi:activating signal cointegrator complex subunit 3